MLISNQDIFWQKNRRRTAGSCTPCRKCHVTDEPYFGTYIVCSYLPFSKAAKGAQCGPQQSETFEQKHTSTEISKRPWSSEKWKWEQAVERNLFTFNHLNPSQANVFLRLTLKLSIFWWPVPLQNISRWMFMFESWNLGYLLCHLRGGVLLLLLQARHGALVLDVRLLHVSLKPARKETMYIDA